MKLKKMLIVIVIIILVACLFLITNKTFLKGYYKINNNAKIPIPEFAYYLKETKENEVIKVELNAIGRFSSADETITEYINNLQSCYDESYFYDAKRKITIQEYSIKKSRPFNKITIKYIIGDLCKDQYVLEENWMDKIDYAKIKEAQIIKYHVENEETKIESKKIDTTEVINIIDIITENDKRIKNQNNFGVEENVVMSTYYGSNMLQIFSYRQKYIAVQITDANDHTKSAIYEIDNPDSILLDIYNKY